MTVELSTSTVSYICNGGTVAFAVPFKFFNNLDLDVRLTDPNTGAVTPLFYGSDFTVTGAGDDAGGTLTTNVAPGFFFSLLISRIIAPVQLTSFPANGTLPSKTIENGLDYLTMVAQQLQASVNVVTTFLGLGAGQPQPEAYQLNASVLLLRNTIKLDTLIPVGYNGMAIFPTIAPDVIVTVGLGSIFTTLDASEATLGGVGLATPNNWLALSTYGVQNGGLTFRLDPAHGDGYISRSGLLPVDPISGEHNGWCADITVSSGSASIVPIHGHAISAGAHTGNAFGAAFESYVLNNKSGGGVVSKAVGLEADSIVMIYNSTAVQHPGMWAVFKNRLDTQVTPVNGVPTAGNSYNRNTAAVVVDSLPRGSNTIIECGWQTGLRFNAASLDSAAGVKATGIDLTPLDAAAPEGGKYYNRLISGLALPDNLPMSLSTNKLSGQIRYNDAGTIEFMNNNSQRVMFGMGNSTIFQWDGVTGHPYDYWIDTAGNALAIMNVQSGNPARTAAPANTSIVRVWLAIKIDGVTFRFPGYQ